MRWSRCPDGLPTAGIGGASRSGMQDAADARSTEMLGVIGGSGFYTFFGSDARSVGLDTPYGAPSAPITGAAR